MMLVKENQEQGFAECEQPVEAERMRRWYVISRQSKSGVHRIRSGGGYHIIRQFVADE